ncbi:MAG: nucleotidyltransferase domain-containing protein [Motilibacteraceae bacterium]
MDEQLPPGGEPLGEDPPWSPWTPAQVAARLAGVEVPWAVAGGWAIDLFRGHRDPSLQPRAHDDLEIAVPAAGFAAVRAALADLDVDVVGSGRRWPLTAPGAANALGLLHQTWFRDRSGVYVLDVFREPHDGDSWICRRDPAIRRPYADLVQRDRGGVPYLAPEVVLLFKARHARGKDEDDLAAVLPLLSPAQRSWLATSLRQVHPGHAWLERLAG